MAAVDNTDTRQQTKYTCTSKPVFSNMQPVLSKLHHACTLRAHCVLQTQQATHIDTHGHGAPETLRILRFKFSQHKRNVSKKRPPSGHRVRLSPGPNLRVAPQRGIGISGGWGRRGAAYLMFEHALRALRREEAGERTGDWCCRRRAASWTRRTGTTRTVLPRPAPGCRAHTGACSMRKATHMQGLSRSSTLKTCRSTLKTCGAFTPRIA